jgi:hypothetical protein
VVDVLLDLNVDYLKKRISRQCGISNASSFQVLSNQERDFPIKIPVGRNDTMSVSPNEEISISPQKD